MAGDNPKTGQADELQDWCRRAAAGEDTCAEKLIWAHQPRLASYIQRQIGVDWRGKIDPEDVLQEAYTDIFARIGSLAWTDEDSFYRWATNIIDHKFIDQVRHLRRKKRDTAREVALGGSSLSKHEALLNRCLADTQTASRIVRAEEAAGALMSCIARLPETHRLVVRRLYLNEEPLSVVAADLDRSEDAVRHLAARALKSLSACLGRASRYFSSHP